MASRGESSLQVGEGSSDAFFLQQRSYVYTVNQMHKEEQMKRLFAHQEKRDVVEASVGPGSYDV